MERRQLSQGGMELFEHRLRTLESENLPHRMTTVENTIAQVQAQVTAITEISKGIGTKLDASMDKLQTKGDLQYERLNTQQIQFMGFTRGVVAVGALIGAVVGLGPTLLAIFRAAVN